MKRPTAAQLAALIPLARRNVLGFAGLCVQTEPDRLRRVSREVDRLVAAAGMRPLVVNEPPPGWSVEEDEREEWQALSEHLALRRIA